MVAMPQGRIYRGTSTAPHIGKLDPTGYITRGIRQSRKRSGLASTALNVMKNRSPVVTKATGKTVAQPILTHVPVPNPTTGTTNTLSTNEIGRVTLQPATTPTNNDPNSPENVMPYTDSSALSRDALAKTRDDTLNSLTNLRAQLSSKITGQERSLDNSQPELARRLLNNFAGRGMAYSSGYGMGVGNQRQQYADQKSALEQQLREGLANYDTQQQQANDAYAQGLAQLNFQDAGNLAGQAGNLGIGQMQGIPNQTLQALAALLAGKS